MDAASATFLDSALRVARQAAAAAADVIRHHYACGVTAETKADATPVTIADREAEIAIKHVLRARVSRSRFLRRGIRPRRRREISSG